MINLGEITKSILTSASSFGILFWVSVAVVILFCVIAYFFIEGGAENEGYRYEKKSSIMTPTELKFFRVLESAIGEHYYIFPQIHLDMVLEHKVKGQNWNGARRHMSQKSVDFVLCDPQSMETILVIELDDFSHARVNVVKRDKEVSRMLKSASIPLCRFIVTKTFDPNEIRKVIYSALDTNNAK
jgi:hypothetical protein